MHAFWAKLFIQKKRPRTAGSPKNPKLLEEPPPPSSKAKKIKMTSFPKNPGSKKKLETAEKKKIQKLKFHSRTKGPELQEFQKIQKIQKSWEKLPPLLESQKTKMTSFQKSPGSGKVLKKTLETAENPKKNYSKKKSQNCWDSTESKSPGRNPPAPSRWFFLDKGEWFLPRLLDFFDFVEFPQY